MPWKIEDVDRFKKGLTDEEKKRWVEIANSAYKQCEEEGEKSNLDCEVSAIRIANRKFSDKNFSVVPNTCPGVPGLNFKKFQEIAMQEAEVTDEYQMVLPVGLFWSKLYGEIIITKGYCQAMVDNWKEGALREQKPFVDTEHDRGMSNGWINDLEARDDGLYAKIEWTDLGKNNVGGGLYKYFSADIDSVMDIDTGEEIYPVLVAVALCNTPVMKTMPQAHLSEKGHQDNLGLANILESAIIKKNPAHSDGVQYISKDKNKDMEELLKLFMALSQEERVKFAEKLAETLKGDDGKKNDPEKTEAQLSGNQGQGVPPATTSTSENTKLAELVKQNEQMAAQLKQLTEVKGRDSGSGQQEIKTDDPVVAARIEALEHSNRQMAEQIERIVKKDHAERKEKFIAWALAEGKILPKDKAFWEDKFDKDPTGVPEVLKRTPSLNLFTEEGTGSDGTGFSLNETAEQKSVREKLGISPEDAAKYGEGYKPPR